MEKQQQALLDRLLAVLEDWQWTRLLFHIANITNGTGWGEVKISLKDGKMIEISSTMTEKPKPPV
jgi:hypothetical protein